MQAAYRVYSVFIQQLHMQLPYPGDRGSDDGRARKAEICGRDLERAAEEASSR